MHPSHFTKDGHPIHGRATFAERVTYRQQQLMGTCVYFTGISQQRCQAGVPYWPIGPQPCLLRYDTGQHVCAQRTFPDEATAHAQAVKDEQQTDATLARLDARLDAKECIHCGTPYTHLRQVGPCVYADPCGHRQYQGQVPSSGEDGAHA